MGPLLKSNINTVQANIVKLYNKLANMAFWDATDQAAAEPTPLDWNVPDKTLTLANNLNHPLATCYATNSRPDVSDPKVPFVYLDNICTKGFAMSNITLIDDGTLTDHCAVWCDLTLID